MNWDLSKLYSGFDDPKLIADAGAAFEQVANIRAMIAKLPGDAPAENLAAVVRAMQSAAGLQIKVSEALIQIFENYVPHLITSQK